VNAFCRKASLSYFFLQNEGFFWVQHEPSCIIVSMNKLPDAKRVQVIACTCEGDSIRSGTEVFDYFFVQALP
jgi:hypothetical protein